MLFKDATNATIKSKHSGLKFIMMTKSRSLRCSQKAKEILKLQCSKLSHHLNNLHMFNQSIIIQFKHALLYSESELWTIFHRLTSYVISKKL